MEQEGTQPDNENEMTAEDDDDDSIHYEDVVEEDSDLEEEGNEDNEAEEGEEGEEAEDEEDLDLEWLFSEWNTFSDCHLRRRGLRERLRDRLRPEVLSESDETSEHERHTKKGNPRKVKPEPTDLLFPMKQRGLLNTILAELKMKHDRDGNMRTSYSLRHTYICFRLMEGADIYQIAKNCRTSIEMIEKFYASHIKTTLDASSINVRKGVIQRERRGREGGSEEPSRTARKPREGGQPGKLRREPKPRNHAPDRA